MFKQFHSFCKLLILLLFHNQILLATIYYVKTTGNDNNNGTSWNTAFATVQKALDVAQAGDQIWVASGVYKPNYDYGIGNGSYRYYHFRLKDGVVMYGGFAGTESSPDQRTDYGDGGSNETILSGDVGIEGDHSDNCLHVFYHPDISYSLSQATILDGFTIKYGRANIDGAPHDHGGGMFNGNLSNPIIRNCIFTSNVALYGAAIYNGGNQSTYINCLIFSNNALFWGGAMYCNGSSPTLVNCTIVNNSSSLGGGFLNYLSSSSPILNNCIIWGNNGSNGKQFYVNGGPFILNYCCFSNGEYDVFGTVNTNNCINSNPEFVSYENKDYRVLGISPCVDAGNNTYNSETFDIRGYNNPRKLDKSTGDAGIIDIGAYEYKVNLDPLPVELTSFTATVILNGVLLIWRTETEVNNFGFEIQRLNAVTEHSSLNNWQKIGFVQGSGNSNAPKQYSFIDQNPIGGKLKYRLKQIDNDGTFKYSDEIEINIENEIPRVFELHQNYPNPFNPKTTIRFTLAESGPIQLIVYNSIGEEVKRLINNDLHFGFYEVEFNGSDLPSGVYIIKLSQGKNSQTKKLVLVK